MTEMIITSDIRIFPYCDEEFDGNFLINYTGKGNTNYSDGISFIARTILPSL